MGSIKPNGLYCAYLRKSRRDVELEALGQGETLARHEKQLAGLADRLGVRVARWYREIVSGDTISERPQVRQLLEDVGAGLWDGVLVMDVDRLGRGDSIDQGVIMQTFMYAGVLIVTPDKIYDPTDDSDAEFFEIKLFFSRREYSMIKKRMQRGRLASAMDGCYMGSRPVYGYERVKLQGRKGWTLKVVPEKAGIVRAVFEWYAHGMDGRDVGAAIIADRLNGMGLRTDLGNAFEPSYIRLMLQNPVYIGKVQWNQRQTQYAIRDGKRVSSRPKSANALTVDGRHPAIIDEALFNEVQAMFRRHEKRPKNKMAQVANPLGGLVVCAQCGRHLQLKGDKNRRAGFLGCVTQHCLTCSTSIDVVEGVVLDGLRAWLGAYEAREGPSQPPQSADAYVSDAARTQLSEQLATLEGQSGRLFDLLEQGVYDVATFRERRADLDARIADLRAALAALDAPPRPDPVAVIVPQVRTVLGAYALAATPAEKNALLRTVLDHITYSKTQRCYRNNAPTDHLILTLYPRIPEETESPEPPVLLDE
ncbi:MAG: recombinase family protein [Oscillospiraceae bacterium]|nr:recombinase family protein [Oscillospiraceae bacterium]